MFVWYRTDRVCQIDDIVPRVLDEPPFGRSYIGPVTPPRRRAFFIPGDNQYRPERTSRDSPYVSNRTDARRCNRESGSNRRFTERDDARDWKWSHRG